MKLSFKSKRLALHKGIQRWRLRLTRPVWMQPCYSHDCCHATIWRGGTAATAPTFNLPRRSHDAIAAKRGKMLFPRNFIRRPATTDQTARGLDCKNTERKGGNAETREDSVRKDLTRRLKGVCADLSSKEFEVLVGDMTREQLRGESIPGRKLGPC
jgi:hypothetical protein